MEDKCVREGEASKILGISVRALQKWRQQGKGPPYRKDGFTKQSPVRYPLDLLYKYQRECMRQTYDGRMVLADHAYRSENKARAYSESHPSASSKAEMVIAKMKEKYSNVKLSSDFFAGLFTEPFDDNSILGEISPLLKEQDSTEYTREPIKIYPLSTVLNSPAQ